MTQPDQHLEQILQSTLGSGQLPADPKRLHLERLGLLTGPTPATLPANSRFPSAGTSNEFRTITSTAGGNLRDRLELITIVAVIALVIGGVVFSRMFLAGDGTDEPSVGDVELTSDYDVYVMQHRTLTPSPIWTPVDRETLENRNDLDEVQASGIAAPFGQSEIVRIEYPDQEPDPVDPSEGVRIVVLDTATGEERRSFHAPGFVQRPHLSPDGSTLAVQPIGSSDGEDLPDWLILDAGNGRVISRIFLNAADRVQHEIQEMLIFSFDGSMLYQVLLQPVSQTTTPEPLRILAYDTASGEQVERLELDNIPAGVWHRQPEAGPPVSDILQVGVAVSPDGRRMAIAHADSQSITLVNLDRLAVERTFAFSTTNGQPDPWYETVLENPEDFSRERVEMGITFSADGRHLYIYGAATSYVTKTVFGMSTQEVVEHHPGLIAIDVEQGSIAARAFENQRVFGVTVAPDGWNIYTTHAAPTDDQMLVRRLDAETLDPLAEREFQLWGSVVINPIILPAPPARPEIEKSPLQFIMEYRASLNAGDLERARSMWIEPFRAFSDDVLFLGESGRPFSTEIEDWTVRENDLFTVVRLNTTPHDAYVLRKSDEGWLLDGGLEALWLMQRRENDDFDRFPGAYRDIRVDQMSDQNPGDTGLHIGISVNRIVVNPNNTMDVSVEWRVTGAEAASFPRYGLSWASDYQSGEVGITWGTIQLTDNRVEFPTGGLRTVIYAATLTLHDIPNNGELRLHMPAITLTNTAGEQRTTSAILHLPVADYPQME